jgi:L-asparaginase/Glu-tRNA(Gln) amidotransferase subunit D
MRFADCAVNYTHWIKLANDIKDHYNQFDAFVILHGTGMSG